MEASFNIEGITQQTTECGFERRAKRKGQAMVIQTRGPNNRIS